MSWVPLTDTIAATRARCAARRKAITDLADHQQAALRRQHWLIRPVVALYFKSVLAAHYTRLVALHATCAVLWCLRLGLITGCLVGLLFIVGSTAILLSSPSDAPPPSIPSAWTSEPTSALPFTQPPVASAATHAPPPSPGAFPLNRPGPYDASPTRPGDSDKRFWTEERKEMATEIGWGLVEAGLRMAIERHGGSQDQVRVNGYHRKDGTYVHPYDRSYPSR